MKTGCFTAIVTPFAGNHVDEEGLSKLISFQIENGITGILAVGTTGESPTLSWNEHINAIEFIAKRTRNHCLCIAGTGSNSTKETLEATKHAFQVNVDAALLVDPYYNGPSSIEIRREYVAPVAEAFPGLTIIPYVIPGRTGAQLFPEDLATLFQTYKNVSAVKEATANIDNMKRTRKCCGPDFTILSGDDGMTYDMMTDPLIKAAGVISVVSNVAPFGVKEMVGNIQKGNQAGAEKLKNALDPLFNLVTVKTTETTPYGDVVARARNPLGIKTLMSILGLPSGGCRKPLGKMTKNGLNTVVGAAKKVQKESPEIFQPLADFFNVNIEDRLTNPLYQKGLCYEDT